MFAAALAVCLPAAGMAGGPGRAGGEPPALDGMDAVSLRDTGRTVPGDPGIVTEWRGRSWLFASETNRTVFEANPRAYAPALKGLCPVELLEGRRVPGDQSLAVVVGDQIYLPHDAAARDRLLRDPGIVPAAQARFRGLSR